MRRSDLLAFFTSSFWLGCNTAFAIVPSVMFAQVSEKYKIMDISKADVGELFGQVALAWGTLSLYLLGLLALSRIIGWVIRLRRHDFKRATLIGVLLFAAIVVFTGLAYQSYKSVESYRKALENLDDDSPQRPLASAQFAREHERSVQLSKILTALLLAQTVVLAVSLLRRSGASTPASAAPIAA